MAGLTSHLLRPFQSSYIEVSEEQVRQLRTPDGEMFGVEIRPPYGETPPTIRDTVVALREAKTSLLGQNRSPTICWELMRDAPNSLSLQIAVPNQRLRRKLINHLNENVPGVALGAGPSGLPVREGDAIGGATLGLQDAAWMPLRSDFDNAPTNHLVGALHPDAMPNARVVVQVLAQPLAGRRIRNWAWRRMAYHTARYLRADKETLTTSFEADELQREQARRLKRKVAADHWFCALRVLVAVPPQDRVDAEDDEDDENDEGDIRAATVASRLKEVTGGFNLYSNDVLGQSLISHPVTPLRRKRLIQFAEAVAARRWAGWHNKFRASSSELGALMAIPSRDQPNLPRNVGGSN